MANYYNVKGWKNSGITPYNRLESREVLNTDPWFSNPDNFFQMKGILANRQAMEDITYIDLQGSVKDVRGDQVNPPNVTGPQGGDGPWYHLERVDYIRLVRTGYPGDEDYVDISDNYDEPWTVGSPPPRVGYYFVTGLQPLARNVTRLFLMFDAWLTCGGASGLMIETGAKVRGPITDAEDEESYNLASESVSVLEPLIVTQSFRVGPDESKGSQQEWDIIVSSVDLVKLSNLLVGKVLDGLIVKADDSEYNTRQAMAKLPVVDYNTVFYCQTPDHVNNLSISYYGLFNRSFSGVRTGLELLFSLGQLYLYDAARYPKYYVEMNTDGDGKVTNVSNTITDVPLDLHKEEITKYPRKAGYMFAQDCVYSMSSGEMNIQNLYDLGSQNVLVWALPTPDGYPMARFKDIKNHDNEFDQAIKGVPWQKAQLVMSGASGSFWNELNLSFDQQTLERRINQTKVNAGINTVRAFFSLGDIASNRLIDYNDMMLKEGTDDEWSPYRAQGAAQSSLAKVANWGTSMASLLSNAYFADMSFAQSRHMLRDRGIQQNLVSPTVFFTPSLASNYFRSNVFGAYGINVTDKDRERLTQYFLRYGYSGLYKPLTDWSVIFVKQKVNYVECENVTLVSGIYSSRVTMECAKILQDGVFLWNCRPDQKAFANNPDRG